VDDKELAHSLYRYWIIAINKGQGFSTYPENFAMMVGSAARQLEKNGYPELCERLRKEWRRKSGLVYRRYYAKKDEVDTLDIDAGDERVSFTEEEVAIFKKRFQKWLETNSDPLTLSREAYHRRLKARAS
jgi:hypothetical protein